MRFREMRFREIREIKNEKITNSQTTNTFTNEFDPDARINPTQNNTPTTTYYDVDKRIVIK
jgi:hypothetical protein